MVDILLRQTTQMGRLLDDLLDMARVTTGKLVLRREPVDLGGVVRDSLATLAAADRMDGHRITCEAGAAWVDGDATRLEQIVVNLVGNALKFTSPGGRIEVRCGPEDHAAVLRVRDDGAGIDAALLPRVFDLFAQHDPTENHSGGGLGIGLTLVRKVVELHGGTVSAASAGRGRGTEITVRLPLASPPQLALDGGSEPPALRARAVLLVEDNPDVRESLLAALGLQGHVVTAASTGRAALEAALQHRPDVAIIDIGLPDMSGVAVARELRARHGAAIRLVALSGFGAEVDDGARFDVRLVKPVDGARLAALVGELCLQPQRAA
jgi:CheY-like chemotaxis protein/anti-sigma regulatory factor (Ser/Thr protein kinase)